MRRELKEPCLLFEDFGDAALAREVASHERGAAWSRSYGGVCISRYSSGEEGRAARRTYIRSAQWRSVYSAGPGQPVVYWLAEMEMPWREGMAAAVVYTTDVERRAGVAASEKRPALATRGALPAGPCWAVIGHPGRVLMAVLDGKQIDAVVADLTSRWGPAAQAPRCIG